MSLRVFVAAAVVSLVTLPVAAQDRGSEETERISRKFTIGNNGRFTLANIAGDIAVTAGSGDEVTIDAVKRTRGSRSDLARVVIDIDDRPGRVDVRTRHTARRDRTRVDYTVTVPREAIVDVSSISGDVRVTNLRGPVRAQSVSGTITASGTTNVEYLKTISGDVELTGDMPEARLTASTVSGTVRARNLEARSVTLSAISGQAEASNVESERLEMKTVTGDLIFDGTPPANGRFEFNTHSGDIRAILRGGSFELNASTLSGNIRSDLPVTVDSRTSRATRGRGRSMRAVVGNGSATLSVSTFSGDIVIERR